MIVFSSIANPINIPHHPFILCSFDNTTFAFSEVIPHDTPGSRQKTKKDRPGGKTAETIHAAQKETKRRRDKDEKRRKKTLLFRPKQTEVHSPLLRRKKQPKQRQSKRQSNNREKKDKDKASQMNHFPPWVLTPGSGIYKMTLER